MASNTPNLGLLKKDPATDGNETFNIKTMLNDNWDKIDQAIKLVEDAVEDISIPDASLTKKGITQLSSAIDRDHEDRAATEKAVHDATKYADAQIEFTKAQIQQESKQVIRGMERELANLNLQLEASKRVPSGVTFGSNFADSFGMEIDTTKLTAKAALTKGQTEIPVDSIGSIKAGMEVTVFDDTNIERTTVMEAKTVETVSDNVVTDATVANSAYDTSGNGGRKLVRLDNGWLVAATFDTSNVYFRVSKDNGLTFSSLCRATRSSIGGAAIVSAKNTVYAHVFRTNGQNLIYTFDATTIADIDIDTVDGTTLDSSQTFIGSCSLAINETLTELHAAWSSKNSTYPNSFNIRYAKGIINADRSVTWGAVAQLTSANDGANLNQNPSIVVNSAGNPVILYQYTNNYGIGFLRFSSNTWYSGTVYNVGNTTHTQSSPSAVFVPQGINGLPNGRIWVAWEGYDSAVTDRSRIRVSYSDNGGGAWSIPSIIEVSGYQSYKPSITANKNNEIFITFESNNLYKVKCTNGTWGSPVSINGLAMGASTLFDQFFSINFTDPLYIYRGSSTNTKVGFYGTWKTTVSVPTLKLAPLAKAYKAKAIIARTSAVIDTVNKCAKFGGWDTEVNNNVMDSLVVNAAYDTSGNGGRKLVRLSNGWIVAAVTQPSTWVFFYVSKDSGVTFNQLCSIGLNSNLGISICSKGTTVYALITWSAAGEVAFYKIDALTQSNVDLSAGSRKSLDSSQSSIGNGTIAINDEGTELHAAWTSKNSTYPQTYNLRYSKGIINSDGAVTWGAVEPVTKFDNSSYSYSVMAPSISLKDGVPIIMFQSDNRVSTVSSFTAGSSILIAKRNKDLVNAYCHIDWSIGNIYYNSNYSPLSPSAIYVPKSINGLPNGRVWVTWYGNDSVDINYTNIHVSYSDDGGITWSAMQKLTSGNSYANYYPSITASRNGDVFVLFSGFSAASPSIQQIKKIRYSSGAWGSPEVITSNTANTNGYPSALYDARFNFSSPLFIFTGNKGTQYVGFCGSSAVSSESMILENDIRFRLKDTDEAVAWVQHDAGLTVTAALNGQTMDKTTVGNEDQFVKALATPGSAEIRLTMQRSSTSDGVKINKILGGVS